MVSLEYKEWCLHSGVKVHGIDAGFVQHGWRGVVATQPIQPGQTILEVPEALLMSKRSAMADASVRAAVEQHPTLSSVQVLGIHLLHELSLCRTAEAQSKHNPQQQQQDAHSRSTGGAQQPGGSSHSRWQLYLEHLPRSYLTLCTWSPAEAEALQQLHAQEAAAAAADDARQQWLGALPALRALGLPRKFLGLPAWLWAASTLMSRTMYLPFDSAGALTPFGDLHNYLPPPPPFTPDMFKGLLPPAPSQQQQQRDGFGAGSMSLGAQEPLDQAAGPPSEAPKTSPEPAGEGLEAEVAQCRLQGEGIGARAQQAAALTQYGVGTEPRAEQESGSGGGVRPGQRLEQRAEQRAAACAMPGGLDLGSLDAEGRVGFLGSPEGVQRGCKGERGEAEQSAGVGGGAVEEEQGGARDEGEDQDARRSGGDGHYDEAAGVYRLVARQQYNPGDQVFLCYGRHTNLELLQHYGFLLQDNPHEQVLLPPELLEAEMREGPGPGAAGGLAALLPSECYLHANGRPSWALLQALRTLAEPPAERRRSGHVLAAGERVSLLGDLRAAAWLRGACRRLLSSMPTSLAEDEELMRSWGAGAQGTSSSCPEPAGGQEAEAGQQVAGISPRLQLAVEWRACQKRIVANAIQSLERFIERVTSLVPADDADRVLGRGRYRPVPPRGKCA